MKAETLHLTSEHSLTLQQKVPQLRLQQPHPHWALEISFRFLGSLGPHRSIQKSYHTFTTQWQQLTQRQTFWGFLSMRRNTDWRLEQWRSEGLLHQTETGRLNKLWRTRKENWKSSSITLSPAEHQTESSCWRLQIREDRDNKQGLFVLLHTLTSDLYLFCLLLIIFPMETIWVRVQSLL